MVNYCVPDCSPGAELASLKAHSEYFRLSRENFVEPTLREREVALQICEEAYRAARYRLPSDFMERSHFDRVCRGLQFPSSPGYPYCLQASSIGQWLGWDGVELNPERMNQLWMDVQAFLSGRMDTLYRVFIKDEPHTLAKKALGRWRLIICPPLCEQIAWTMVFGPGNDREIETVGLTPSLQGMKLCGGDWKNYLQLFRQNGLRHGLDKSAWDWTCHEWLIYADLDARSRQLDAPPAQQRQWEELSRLLYDRAFISPCLLLSDGTIWRQMYPGIMKSGCVNTISTNSRDQVLAHVLACLRAGLSVFPLPRAVGDDTLGDEQNTPTAADYLTLGVVLKDVVGLQFVGHHWCDFGTVPAYVAKHLFRYSTVALADLHDFLESMVLLYAHDEAMQAVWYELAYGRGLSLPSPAFTRFWYDWSSDVIPWER